MGPMTAPLVIVSPHFDDAALSCVSLVARHPGAVLLTVFGAGPSRVDPLTRWDRASGFAPGDDVIAALAAEDSDACEALGARQVRLKRWDSQYLTTRYGYDSPPDGGRWWIRSSRPSTRLSKTLSRGLMTSSTRRPRWASVTGTTCMPSGRSSSACGDWKEPISSSTKSCPTPPNGPAWEKGPADGRGCRVLLGAAAPRHARGGRQEPRHWLLHLASSCAGTKTDANGSRRRGEVLASHRGMTASCERGVTPPPAASHATSASSGQACVPGHI
jgi:hypothetical protein